MRFKVLLCLCVLSPIKLVFSTEIVVPLSYTAILPCSFPLELPANEKFLDVTWSFRGSVIASINHTDPGFNLDTSNLLNGSAPLTVYNTTPHQQGVYECSVNSNGTEHYSNVTLTVLAAPSVSITSPEVVLGQESVIECWAKSFSPPQISFSWTRAGKRFRPPQRSEGMLAEDGLYEAVSRLVFVPELHDRNITYSCVVQHEELEKPLVKKFKPSIIILPTVSLSIVPPASRSSPLTLACDLRGFYPENISVVWVQNSTVLPEPPLTHLNSDGSYRTRWFHTLSAEERERGGAVQCVAHQPHVSQPASSSIDLSTIDPLVRELVLSKSAKASVAMMIISLILILLLCLGFSWKRRDEKQKSLSISAIILPPQLVVGRKGRVTISIEGRRADRVQTVWFLNNIPIADTSYSEKKSLSPSYSTGHTPRISRVSLVSEKSSLLPATAPGYYKLHTRHPLLSNGPIKQLLSSFTFIPNLSIHKGAVFKCQISYKGKDKIVMEKVSDKFTILALPEVSEIQLSEPNEVTGIVTLTVTASHFHPDVITFRWFCEGGELCPVAAPPGLSAPRPDAQGFFSAMSQCRLPKAELERGRTTVWVTIHHMSLKQPITRKTRGFIKRPTVSEIHCTPSFPDQGPLTLTCDISDFYPPDVSVKWLRRGRNEGDEQEVEEAGAEGEEGVKGAAEVWGPIQTQPRAFRATALLKEVENVLKEMEEGGEIVCRVEHCALQEPVERVWRKNCMVAPSIPLSLSVNWRNDGVGVFSLCMSAGVPHPKMLWAAGGSSLTQLISREKEKEAESGARELLSVCALVKSEGPQRSEPHPHSRRNGHLNGSQFPVFCNEVENGHTDLREREQENHTETAEEKWTQTSEAETEDGETEPEFSYINTVNVRREGRRGEKERLRVVVEITHPALSLPVYRTWTEPDEEVSS
ncbi:hypothetical protein AMEX_G18237 [Astyanax mexicanus]|uniref:Ig-like domain-containing protein n=1 Tax=Astyanax mexicanus TaxID=7994 RepID=A0A8T2LBT0_ASTMX|nr:hypothetical protein AMEX_G18237 [Astyanax mexicanus]